MELFFKEPIRWCDDSLKQILKVAVLLSFDADHQKLEREARICRLLKHPNIGRSISLLCTVFVSLENLGEMEINKCKEQLRNQVQVSPGRTFFIMWCSLQVLLWDAIM